MGELILTCALCRRPCEPKAGVRDRKGNFYHKNCYDAAKAKRAAREAADRGPGDLAADASPELTLLASHEAVAPAVIPAELCPSCSGDFPAAAVICTKCGYSRKTGKAAATTVRYASAAPAPRSTPFWRCHVFEVAFFALAIGGLIAMLGFYMVFTMPIHAPPYLGMPRAFGVGMPTFGVAALNIVSGILLIQRRKTYAVALCYLGAVAVPLLYFGLMIGAGMGARFNCLSVLLIAVPVIVVSRGKRAVEELERP